METERVKVDLHNHLGRNGAFTSFDDVINIAYSKLGPGGIVGIANCNDFRYERFVDSTAGKYTRNDIHSYPDKTNSIGVFVPEKTLIVLKAQEVFAQDGHLLVVGVPNRINIGAKTLKETFAKVKDLSGAITIVDHPFYKSGAGWEVLKYEPDGWEVYNASAELFIPGFLPRGANEKSLDFYQAVISKNSDFNIGACSFTDGHSQYVIGTSYTEMPICLVSDPSTGKLIFRNSLKSGVNSTKDIKYLHREPNKKDALIHTIYMGAGTKAGEMAERILR